MAKPYRICKRCEKRWDEVGLISRSGLCLACGHSVLVENIELLVEHRGTPLERWRRGVAASVGAVLLDDLVPEPQTDADAR